MGNARINSGSRVLLLLFSQILICYSLAGCAIGTSDVSHESIYATLVGQHYRTKVDLYLFTTAHAHHPYVGMNGPGLSHSDKTLPVIVEDGNIGKTFQGALIVDVVPAGSELISRSVLRNVSGQGEIVFMICSLYYKGKQVDQIDAYFIQSNISGSDGGLPEINPLIAERSP